MSKAACPECITADPGIFWPRGWLKYVRAHCRDRGAPSRTANRTCTCRHARQVAGWRCVSARLIAEFAGERLTGVGVSPSGGVRRRRKSFSGDGARLPRWQSYKLHGIVAVSPLAAWPVARVPFLHRGRSVFCALAAPIFHLLATYWSALHWDRARLPHSDGVPSGGRSVPLQHRRSVSVVRPGGSCGNVCNSAGCGLGRDFNGLRSPTCFSRCSRVDCSFVSPE